MNIRDLKYLVALSDYGHFGKAAEICCVSQPGLSMQIKKLEETLGVQLIERTNKSILFTEVGHEIVKRAKEILNKIEGLYEVSQAVKDPYQGELSLGIIPSLSPYLLPHIMQPLAALFPKISWYLIEEKTDILIEKLRTGQIHAAILAMPIFSKDFNHSSLFEEEFFVAVPKSDSLSNHKTVQYSDLLDKNILLLEEGHCFRDQALAICNIIGLSENKNFRATSLETLKHMVVAKAGITLVPKLACTLNDSISYIPFKSSDAKREVGLFWRQSSGKQIFLESLASSLQKMTQSI